MATQVQLRRGNTSQTNAFTGAVAEITIDTDKETVVVHDGSTAGGFALARESALTANSFSVTAAFNTANAAFLQANTPSYTSNSAASYANSAFATANSAFAEADSAASYANSAFVTANASFLQANTPSYTANSAASYANSAYTQANTATTNASTADDKAVTAGSYANSAYTQANTATTNAATADAKAVTAGSYANSAFLQANTPSYTANSAASYANSAFTVANTKFASAGGTISGDVIVTGNLTIQGQQTYANTQTVLIADNIITVNAAINQASAPAFNAGIEVDRGSSANTSLLWNESTDKWTATNDGTNYFNLASDAAESYANSAYTQANTATTNAATADAKAITAGSYANSAFLQANTPSYTANSAASYANAAFDVANTASASGTSAGSYANAAFLQANTPSYTANSAASYANSAFSRANNSLDTTTGGSVTGAITASGNVRADYVVANTAFASAAGLSKLELTDIGLAAIKVAGETYQFGASGIESPQGVFGGSFGGNRLSLNNETNLISNRYDIVKIQTGTDGTVANEFTFANNTFSAPGSINVATRLDWTGTGYAQPSFTTRSAGQKITLYPAISGSAVDYSIGIDGGVLWSTVPVSSNEYSFKWYGGQTQIASLSGVGTLDVISANITSSNTSTSNTTGALRVTGGVGVRGNVATDGVIFADGTRQTTAAVGGGASIGDVLALSIALG
jgi:hypothetical protein